jgi:hypothetical protein
VVVGGVLNTASVVSNETFVNPHKNTQNPSKNLEEKLSDLFEIIKLLVTYILSKKALKIKHLTGLTPLKLASERSRISKLYSPRKIPP